MIKTSVIVPVYNTESYLKDCFESIFKQTQKDIEVIAINDGSTDNSLYILEQIKKNYPQMVIFTQDNKGLGSARNKGIELARGEFICFIDSDDCLVNTAIEICYRCAKDNSLDVVMFDAKTFGDVEYETDCYNRSEIIVDQEVVLRGEDFAEKYWLKSFVPSACLMYMSTRFLRQHNLEFLPRIYYEDNEFCCRMIPLAQRVMYIPQRLYKRRYRKLSITTVPFDLRHARDMLTMIQSVGGHQYSDKLIPIIHKLQLDFLRSLYNRCLKAELLRNIEFFQELYSMALNICGDSIESISLFSDIDLLSHITNEASQKIVSKQAKKIIETKRKELLKEIFDKVPIGSEGQYIGIYGTGKNTERFLNEYLKYVNGIKATLIFIDSNITSKKERYKGFDIFNINDIENMPLKCIIVASSKYELAICQTIKEKYGDKFKVLRLQSDLHF